MPAASGKERRKHPADDKTPVLSLFIPKQQAYETLETECLPVIPLDPLFALLDGSKPCGVIAREYRQPWLE
jgi:hypothetical protein